MQSNINFQGNPGNPDFYHPGFTYRPDYQASYRVLSDIIGHCRALSDIIGHYIGHYRALPDITGHYRALHRALLGIIDHWSGIIGHYWASKMHKHE